MSPDHRPPTSRGPSRSVPAAPVMPEVMEAMTAAVARRAVPVRRRRRWLGRGAVLGVGLALVSGSALAATGTWNPFTGTRHHGYTLDAVPPGDTETLAVLRRAQTDRDRSPLMADFLRMTARGGPMNRVYLRYVRFLRSVEWTEMGGWNGTMHRRSRPGILVLIPSEVSIPHVTLGTGAETPKFPQHQLCLSTVVDTWPAGAQPPLMWQAPVRATTPRAALTRPARLEDRVAGGSTCASVHEIRTKGLIAGAFNYGALTGIVPDGVASVRITTRTGAVLTDQVVNNSFELLAPGRGHLVRTVVGGRIRADMPALSAQFRHQTLQWLAADGQIIRHVPR